MDFKTKASLSFRSNHFLLEVTILLQLELITETGYRLNKLLEIPVVSLGERWGEKVCQSQIMHYKLGMLGGEGGTCVALLICLQ